MAECYSILANTAKAPPSFTVEDLASRSERHFNTLVIAAGICGWISLCLIVRFWQKSRGQSWSQRLMWSVILCIPVLGWLVYGGCYRLAPVTDIPAPDQSNIFMD